MSEKSSAPRLEGALGHIPESQPYSGVNDLKWEPADDSSKQRYIKSWMENVITEDLSGEDLHDNFVELLPPKSFSLPKC